MGKSFWFILSVISLEGRSQLREAVAGRWGEAGARHFCGLWHKRGDKSCDSGGQGQRRGQSLLTNQMKGVVVRKVKMSEDQLMTPLPGQGFSH